jgi:hypothetical protein
MFRANAEINLRMAEALVWEHTRPRVQFPASRRKNLFGETPNTTRGDAYAPQTHRNFPIRTVLAPVTSNN